VHGCYLGFEKSDAEKRRKLRRNVPGKNQFSREEPIFRGSSRKIMRSPEPEKKENSNKTLTDKKKERRKKTEKWRLEGKKLKEGEKAGERG
jgi:hypothetical protein